MNAVDLEAADWEGNTRGGKTPFFGLFIAVAIFRVEHYSVGCNMRNMRWVIRDEVSVCRGAYACIQPHRDTYGKYRDTVANVDASEVDVNE